MMGDDLGSKYYINLLSQLEFTNIPYLKNYSISPYIYAEATFYPPYDAFLSHYSSQRHNASSKMDKITELKRYTRGGTGFGMKIPISAIGANLHFWHNLATFNTK